MLKTARTKIRKALYLLRIMQAYRAGQAGLDRLGVLWACWRQGYVASNYSTHALAPETLRWNRLGDGGRLFKHYHCSRCGKYWTERSELASEKEVG